MMDDVAAFPIECEMAVTDQDLSSSADVPTGRQQLLAYLHERDVPCPACGYNLRNLTSARCPECGRELRLGVKLRHPRMGAWVTLLIALAMSNGVAFLLGVIILERRFPSSRMWNIPLYYFVSAIPLTGIALMYRRRFLRIRIHIQWTVAVLTAILSTVMAIVLVSGF